MARLAASLALLAMVATASATVMTYDEWKNLYVVSMSDGRKYVKNTVENYPDSVSVSEAIGYGLMAAVLTDHKDDFDGFMKFYQSFRNKKSGMMAWQISDTNGKLQVQPRSEAHADDSGTDGDMDAAAAFQLAYEKWGGAEYKKLATETSDALLKYAVNPTSHLPNLGDWVSSDPNAYQDRGAPGVGPRQYHYVSRPSDCMAWNMVILSKINSKWNQVKDACIEGIAQLSSMSDCGLVADFGVWDPSTKRLNPAPYDRPLLEKGTDSAYSWNACRAPWRLAAYIKHTNDPKAKTVASRMNDFFERQADGKLVGTYTLPGCVPRVDYGATAFAAPAASLLKVMGSSKAGAMEAQATSARQWPAGRGYYGDSIALLSDLMTQ